MTITQEIAGFCRVPIVVRAEGVPRACRPCGPGRGCERLDDRTAACVAGIIGPVYLGDGDDRIDSPGGDVYGGEGAAILSAHFGGGAQGDDGDHILSCFPPEAWCQLDGGWATTC